jgi:hypothetical protein
MQAEKTASNQSPGAFASSYLTNSRISISITAIAQLSFGDVLLVFSAPCKLRLLSGLEHGRTIP